MPGWACSLAGIGSRVDVLSWPMRLQVAREHAEAWSKQQLGRCCSNMRFLTGHIEFLDR